MSRLTPTVPPTRRLRPPLWSIRLLWQGAVTLGFVFLVLRSVDFERFREAVEDVEPLWIPPALVLFTCAKYIDSWRWRYLLRDVRPAPPQRALFGAFLIGNMVNNVLPLRLGDAAKIQVLANRYGASRASLAASVFVVEAALDGVVFAMFLIGALAVGELGDLSTVSRAGALSVAALAIVLFGGSVRLSRALSEDRQLGLSWLPERLRGPVRSGLTQARSGLGALRDPPRTGGAIALSIPAWLVEAGMFATFGQAFGLGLDFPTFVVVMVGANLAVAIPIALWNFGPYEALVAGILIAAGTEQSTAISYAVTVHVATNLWIVGAGIIVLWAMRIRPRQVLSWREFRPADDVDAVRRAPVRD